MATTRVYNNSNERCCMEELSPVVHENDGSRRLPDDKSFMESCSSSNKSSNNNSDDSTLPLHHDNNNRVVALAMSASSSSRMDKEQAPLTTSQESSAVVVPVVMEEDWGLKDGCFDLFAQHERYRLPLHCCCSCRCDDCSCCGCGCFVDVECVEKMTPVDMIQLSSGLHDSTGHCIWTGAVFFLRHCVDDLLQRYLLPHNNNNPTTTTLKILELGCGTGIGGIGLALRAKSILSKNSCTCCHPTKEQENDDKEEHDKTSSRTNAKISVTLTDADPNALELCRRNCEINRVAAYCHVEQLNWGDDYNFHDNARSPLSSSAVSAVSSEMQNVQPVSSSQHDPQSHNDVVEGTIDAMESIDLLATPFDCVLATDVLYDLAMLPLLLHTTRTALQVRGSNSCERNGSTRLGYFFLSHVPRACFNSTSHRPEVVLERETTATATAAASSQPKATTMGVKSSLEDYIIQQVVKAGFELVDILRPDQMQPEQPTHSHQYRCRVQGDHDVYEKEAVQERLPVKLYNVPSLQTLEDIGVALMVFRILL